MRDVKLGQIYQSLKTRFKQAGVDKTSLEAFLLLEWAASVTYKDIITDPDRILDTKIIQKIDGALKRRLSGESIHRIRGWREFYGLPFQLSSQTLEPRPDSETLIDLVLPLIKARAKQQDTIRLLDMGTGSGALAIALLAHVPQCQATGVDIAAGALQTAAQNAALHGVEGRFQTLLSDGFAKVEGCYDFIISNPPYIASADIPTLDKTVRDFDPLLALDGGADGLDFYRLLASQSRQFLAPSGKIAVEIGFGQKLQATDLFDSAGFQLAMAADDLSGTCRALLFES